MAGTIYNIRTVVNRITTNPRKLFLLDSAGAFLDALLLGGLLASFPHFFGMPLEVLYVLATMALLYGVYSLGCAYFIPRLWRRWLLVVVVANVLHGLLTIGLVVYHFQRLTALGLVFFVLEVLTLGVVVFLEVKGLKRIAA